MLSLVKYKIKQKVFNRKKNLLKQITKNQNNKLSILSQCDDDNNVNFFDGSHFFQFEMNENIC